jgi:hypothetical protein
MSRKALNKECFNNRHEANYLEKVVKERLKVDSYHTYTFNEREFNTIEQAIEFYINNQAQFPEELHELNDDKLDANHIRNTIASIIALKAQKKYVTKRHQYPRWEEKKDTNGNLTTEHVLVSDNGRPYVFHRSQFLTKAEIDNTKPDAEIKNIADNVTSVLNPESSVPDLPF